MDRYDRLYRLYEHFDTEPIRAYREFVDLFPALDSPVALSYWKDARDRLERRRADVVEAFPDDGGAYADIASRATRDQAFTGLDLCTEYGRTVSVLVLDVDETLRSAGTTDNEIPVETLHFLTEFHEAGVPLVVCTGQTLENVKGFLIQGLGNELVHSGSVSVVYESGTGVFTPGHGPETKRLLYEDLDEQVWSVFETVRDRVFTAAPEGIRRGSHLQGNEFNVTIKPNFETGSDDAVRVVDSALVYLLDLLGGAVAAVQSADPDDSKQSSRITDRREAIADALALAPETVAAAGDWTRAHLAAGDREIRDVLDDPFALVLGDSKSDLKVMRWVDEHDSGVAAAPEHASPAVLDHVRSTDGLVFTPGDATDALATVYALNRLAAIDEDR